MSDVTIEIPILYFGPLPSMNDKYTLSKYKYHKNGRGKSIMILSPAFRKSAIELIKILYPQLLYHVEYLDKNYKYVYKMGIDLKVSKITKTGKGTSMDIDNFLKPFIDMITRLLGYDDKLVKFLKVEGEEGIILEHAKEEFDKMVKKFGILDDNHAKRIANAILKKNHVDKFLIGRGLYAKNAKSRKRKHSNGSIKNSLPKEVLQLGVPLVHAVYMAGIETGNPILVGGIRYDTPSLVSPSYRVKGYIRLLCGSEKVI